MLYASDFETTTLLEDCRVWAYGICEIGNPSNFIYGNTLEGFMEFCENSKTNDTHYFHNIKFDGEFIFYWLFRNGFTFVEDKRKLKDRTFTAMISDKGAFYSMEVMFWRKGKKVKKVKFIDSLKLLNFSVEKIAKDFALPIGKLEIDYKEHRPIGHVLTTDEVDYLRNDVEIMARAIKIMFNQDMDKMTIGSNALAQYKNVIGLRKFDRWFPQLECDAEIRTSYRGGWTYLRDIFKEKTVAKGLVLDVNSLYPWVMHCKQLPYGEALKFKGQYKKDGLYPLYTQRIFCTFRLKKDKLPTIQIKGDFNYKGNEYLKSSEGKDGTDFGVELNLTSVDLQLFFDHYDVFNIDYIDGFMFKSSDKMFKEYIDYWTAEKIKGKKEGNPSKTAIAKLMLNSLYGKFALNPIARSKYPMYVKAKDKLHYTYGEYEEREPIYIPVGAFITSYAREKTIRSAQDVFHRFVYADTDSLHLIGEELPEGLEIHPTDLGAWDNEFKFIKGKYLRQKCYMETGYEPKKPDEIFTKITCAGMPDRCYNQVTYENFKIGSSYKGKLQTTRVPGGIVLVDGNFTIKESFFSRG